MKRRDLTILKSGDNAVILPIRSRAAGVVGTLEENLHQTRRMRKITGHLYRHGGLKARRIDV